MIGQTKWLASNRASGCRNTRRIRLARDMELSFEETLIDVWRQAFAETARVVILDGKRYPIVRTSKRRLRQVEFVFDGKEVRGLEQNPETKSRWAATARGGKRVMQFLNAGRYVANVVDGKITLYGTRS